MSRRPFENPFNGGFERDSSLGGGPQRRSVLRDRHAIDLDVEGPGPLRHAEEDAGWGVLREVALVDVIERLEPVRRDAQHIALKYMVEVRPGGLQRLLHLLQDQLNLALERGVDEDLAGLRIEGRHARDEHHVAGAGAGGHRRALPLEIAVNRLDPDDLSLHASVPGLRVASLNLVRRRRRAYSWASLSRASGWR